MSKHLKSGTRGDAVTALQQQLVTLGFDLQPDGVFGPSTRGAVEELQALFGYDIDGMVGEEMQALIADQTRRGFDVRKRSDVQAALAEAGSATSLDRVLRSGTEGADVRFLQRRMATLGYIVEVDGKFGEATEQAVRRLQKSFGQPVDGSAGQATHLLINEQIGSGWSEQPAARHG